MKRGWEGKMNRNSGEGIHLIQNRQKKRNCKNTKMSNPNHTTISLVEIIAHKNWSRFQGRNAQQRQSTHIWYKNKRLESTPTIRFPSWCLTLWRFERTSCTKRICIIKGGEPSASVRISIAANGIKPRKTLRWGKEPTIIHAEGIKPHEAVKGVILSTVPWWGAGVEQWGARYRVCKKWAPVFLLKQAIGVRWVCSNWIQT